jgi:ligand-binding SRPBCC domain-containing protein
MPKLTFQTTLPASLETVWKFHGDVERSLPALSPPEAEVRIETADLPVGEGSRIVLRVRDPLGRRLRWVARIVEHRPPHAVALGEEARFVDEQESGPFASWRHEHDFERAGDNATRLTDTVTYRPPFGPIGWLADWLFLRRQIRAMFRYRHEATRKLLA